MRSAVVIAAAFILVGCGDGANESEATGVIGAQGASGVDGASTDIAAGEFLQMLLSEKELAVEGVVASEPICEGVKVRPSFILVLSDAAARAEPGTPLTELVEAEC